MHRGDGVAGGSARAWARDVLGAIALAEGAVALRILVADLPGFVLDASLGNCFGEALDVSSNGHVTEQAGRAHDHAAAGERVALVAPASALAAARPVMRKIARDRLGVVFHALDERGCPDAFALADLGWGVVLASSVEDSLDLSLIARRASEDSGTPFLVIHERTNARTLEPLLRPDAALCEAFLGMPGGSAGGQLQAGRLRPISDPAHPVHAKIGPRAFADRVPFALGSAMRELESLCGRRHDVVERSAGSDAAMMIVAAGALGESLLGEVERLRGQGHDVGVVKVTALRPFPGPRLVRALGRSLAVTVLEGVDDPLAQSNPLTREVKAAFADALTWVPGYPGVGRIPRITSGVVGLGGHELDALDFDAMVANMLEGERGKRLFTFGADPDLALDAAVTPEAKPTPVGFAMRGVVKDLSSAAVCAELCASVLASTLALRVRATVRGPASLPSAALRPGSEAATFEVLAGRERPRGAHTPYSVRLVVLDDVAVLLGNNPLARLAHGGIVAVPTHHVTPEALWASLPPYVKAIAFDRHARVIGWPSPEGEPSRWLTAAAFAGVALAGFAKPQAVDPSLVAREVAEALRVVIGHDGPSVEGGVGIAERGGELARRAFEAHLEVPRATIERDADGVRMGRHDERAAVR